MSDSVLDHLTERAARKTQDNFDDADATDDYGAFGWLRGVRDRALYLEFRRKNGDVTALGYSWLESVDFNPSTGLTLHFTDRKVVVRGRNLNAECRENVSLITGILRHRVPWIREADHAKSMLGWADKDTTIIESIEV